MNTHVFLAHEPVADGGFFTRALLVIEGTPPDHGVVTGEQGRVPRSMTAAHRLAATNVRVAVRPGADAEYIQMRHTFPSEGRGNLLTINVGDVYCLDRIRIRMEALVGPASGRDEDEAEVGRLVVVAELRTEEGPALETVDLPIRVSRRYGGRVRAAVSRRPIRTPRVAEG